MVPDSYYEDILRDMEDEAGLVLILEILNLSI